MGSVRHQRLWVPAARRAQSVRELLHLRPALHGVLSSLCAQSVCELLREREERCEEGPDGVGVQEGVDESKGGSGGHGEGEEWEVHAAGRRLGIRSW